MRVGAPVSSLVVAAVLAANAHAQGVIHQLVGGSPDGMFGTAVARAGDVDGDGFADLVVGAVYESTIGPQSGLVRLVSGKTGLPLHTWLGRAATAELGGAVDGGGDVDGDGIPDVVAGAQEPFGTGSVWVYSGATKLPLHHFTGIGPSPAYGWSVAHAGDLDGDGCGDVIVGSPFAKITAFEAGLAIVYSGATGQTLFAWNGYSAGWWEGYDVAAVGDVDADGFLDVASGSPQEVTATIQTGAVRVYSGLTGQVLVHVFGTGNNDGFGRSVAGAGDPDLDGHDDVLVGAPFDSAMGTECGAAVVVSGATGTPLVIAYGNSPFEHFGWSVGHVGDVNGDDRDDLVAGAPDDLEFVGSALTVGSATVFDGATGQAWFVRRGNSNVADFGFAVAGVGDVDGDGRNDVAVGAPRDGAAGVDAGAVVVYSDPFASIESYGSGNPGLGGVTPELATFGGLATPGNAGFALVLKQTVGGAAAVLAIGVAPAALATNFGAVLVDPSKPLFLLPLTVGGSAGQPGAGSAFIAAPIPLGLTLGANAYLQAFVDDPAAAGGIASCAGLRIELAR